jgi:hypothetical protein
MEGIGAVGAEESEGSMMRMWPSGPGTKDNIGYEVEGLGVRASAAEWRIGILGAEWG